MHCPLQTVSRVRFLINGGGGGGAGGQIAGTIVAPASPDEWAGRDPMKWLYVYGVDGLSVSGGGTIDGVGHEWWARSCKRKNTQVPRHHSSVATSSYLSAQHHLPLNSPSDTCIFAFTQPCNTRPPPRVGGCECECESATIPVSHRRRGAPGGEISLMVWG